MLPFFQLGSRLNLLVIFKVPSCLALEALKLKVYVTIASCTSTSTCVRPDPWHWSRMHYRMALKHAAHVVYVHLIRISAIEKKSLA